MPSTVLLKFQYAMNVNIAFKHIKQRYSVEWQEKLLHLFQIDKP